MTGKTFFNPGCALSLYKPDMEIRILELLNRTWQETRLHNICCRHEPQLEKGSVIVNVCAGCDRRFSTLYEGISTISVWEIIDRLDAFDFPDYCGLRLSVQDPCPVREKPQVHQAVRNLLRKMNIEVVETRFHGTRTVCCGDDLYPRFPIYKIRQQMIKRAEAMPCEEVCVYCVSCVKALHIGGRRPRHLLDLLMNESTDPQVYDTAKWHEQLQGYIDTH
ncbi:MAG TPA: (Fe-S)-binding protein [bacterium]|nr:(Fe-S)-binding protein [bacterium]HQI49707.1 (Fe-S)-binding protein [bacterium]HQJ66162.1 (Fe-S)-binding protein [bacterium]